MNELHHLKEFHKFLDNYTVSDAAAKTIADMNLVLVVGPSSSGRNTIISQILKTGEFHFIISDTTRLPRVNSGVLEQNGREYWFRTEEEILEDIKRGEFLEAAVIHDQQVSGISIRELAKAHNDKKIAIADVEVVGAANIHRAKPDTKTIFVIPPDFETWIGRLHRRGELPEQEVRRRLESALEEFESAVREDYYTFVVNDKLDDAVARVYSLTKLGQPDSEEQTRGRAIVETLLLDTQRYLDASR